MSITLNANAMTKTAAKIKRPTRTAAVAHAGVCESVVIATPRSSLFAGTVAQPNVDVCFAHHLRPNVVVNGGQNLPAVPPRVRCHCYCHCTDSGRFVGMQTV